MSGTQAPIPDMSRYPSSGGNSDESHDFSLLEYSCSDSLSEDDFVLLAPDNSAAPLVARRRHRHSVAGDDIRTDPNISSQQYTHGEVSYRSGVVCCF